MIILPLNRYELRHIHTTDPFNRQPVCTASFQDQLFCSILLRLVLFIVDLSLSNYLFFLHSTSRFLFSLAPLLFFGRPFFLPKCPFIIVSSMHILGVRVSRQSFLSFPCKGRPVKGSREKKKSLLRRLFSLHFVSLSSNLVATGACLSFFLLHPPPSNPHFRPIKSPLPASNSSISRVLSSFFLLLSLCSLHLFLSLISTRAHLFLLLLPISFRFFSYFLFLAFSFFPPFLSHRFHSFTFLIYTVVFFLL